MNSSKIRKQTLRPAGAVTAEALARGAVRALESPVSLSVPVRRIATFHGRSPRALVESLPALRALREGFPGAKISAWLGPGLAPLLQDSPLVDEAFARPRSVSSQAALMARLHALHCDVAVCFGLSRNAALLAWATGAPLRAGFTASRAEALFSQRVRVAGAPSPADYLVLAQAAGGRAQGIDLDPRGLLSLPPTAVARADRVLEAAGLTGDFVLVAPERTASRRAKERSHETGGAEALFWRETAGELARRWPVAWLGNAPAPVVMGGEKLPAFAAGGAGDAAPVVLEGRFDWPLIAALGARARAVAGTVGGEIPTVCTAFDTPAVLAGSPAALAGTPVARQAVPCGAPCRQADSPSEVAAAIALFFAL